MPETESSITSLTLTKPRRPWWRRWYMLLCYLILGCYFFGYQVGGRLFVTFSHGSSGVIDIVELAPEPSVDEAAESITVMSLNLAHGRGAGRHQFLRSEAFLKTQLQTIAELVQREDPHLIGLQEVDAPSWWSGSFNHLDLLGRQSSRRRYALAKHVDGLGLHYGTAVLASLSVLDAQALTYVPTPPTTSKGATITACVWPGDARFTFNFVSTHLDFMSQAARRSQMQQLIDQLRESALPLILVGDFNMDMSQPSLSEALRENQWQTYKPEAVQLVTFPTTGKRIDWIIISSEFEFLEHRVLPDVISDHQPVWARIKRVD